MDAVSGVGIWTVQHVLAIIQSLLYQNSCTAVCRRHFRPIGLLTLFVKSYSPVDSLEPTADAYSAQVMLAVAIP